MEMLREKFKWYIEKINERKYNIVKEYREGIKRREKEEKE